MKRKVKVGNQESIDAFVLSGGIGEASTDLHKTLKEKLDGTPLALKVEDKLQEDQTKKIFPLKHLSTRQNASAYPGVPWLICQVSKIC